MVRLVRVLKKYSKESGVRLWRDLAERLSHSRQRRVAVNVSQLKRYTKKEDIVVVPGKVLGTGSIEHPVCVAAFAFSDVARSKILKAKGKCLSIFQLMDERPKGSNVNIIG